MPIKPEKPNQQQEPDELDRRLAMSYRERYDLMMCLFRMGQMMKHVKTSRPTEIEQIDKLKKSC